MQNEVNGMLARRSQKSDFGRALRAPDVAWVEFGCRRRRIRKSKASLGRMWARGAPRYTRVCASTGSPQTAQDRRRVLRTKFETLEA